MGSVGLGKGLERRQGLNRQAQGGPLLPSTSAHSSVPAVQGFRASSTQYFQGLLPKNVFRGSFSFCGADGLVVRNAFPFFFDVCHFQFLGGGFTRSLFCISRSVWRPT